MKVLSIKNNNADRSHAFTFKHKETTFAAFYLKIFRRFVNYMCRFSIRRRLIVYFLILSILTTVLVGTISFFTSRHTINRKITEYSLQNLVQAGTTLDLHLQKYVDLGIMMLLDPALQNRIRDFLYFDSSSAKLYIQELFYDVLLYDNTVNYILLSHLDNDTHVSVGLGASESTLAKVKESPLFQEALAVPGQFCWGVVDTNLTMVNIIRSLSSSQPLAAFIVVYNGPNISKLINDSNLAENRPYSVIVKQNGEILASPYPEQVGTNITDLLASDQINKILAVSDYKTGYFTDKLDKKNTLVTYNLLSTKGWYVMGLARSNYLFREIYIQGLLNVLIIILIAVAAITFSYGVSLSISLPLESIKAAMEKAKNGDLSVKVEITTQDELRDLGNSFNLMTTEIGQLIKDTQQAVDSVSEHCKALETSSFQSAQSAEAVAAATEEITKGTIEQTNEAEKTARQMTVLAEEIDVAAIKFKDVELISNHTRDLSMRSKSIMEDLIRKANETNQITATINNDISELNKRSEEIREVTDLIANIAEQTNLLALNAAIEAARAHELGSGFAVVADEITKLANRTDTAAKAIKDLLKGIEDKALNSSTNVARAHGIVIEQLNVVSQTQATFDEIIKGMDLIVARIADVNTHVRKINEVKDETTQAVLNISAISEEAAASSEQVAASVQEQAAIAEHVKEMANELHTLADKLVNAISKFTI
ncbi:MAG: methyl-accepting chemotaxis protein [Firmicutes bacterium]|nr:methyl-accepting chemotaxis protein [Bacillota bacterium]